MKGVHAPVRAHNWLWLLAADVLALVLAFVVALIMLSLFRHERIGGDFVQWWHLEGEVQSLAFAGLALYCTMRFWLVGHYQIRLPFWDELRAIVQVVASAGLMNVMAVVLLNGALSRFLWPLSWMLALCLLPLARGLARSFLVARGSWDLPTLILGCGPSALAAYRALHSEARLGFAVQGFVQMQAFPTSLSLPAPLLTVDETVLLPWLDEQRGSHLVIALESNEMERHALLLERLSLQRRDLILVPPFSGLPLVGIVTYHFFRQDVLMLALHNNLDSFPRRLIKRSFDVLGAASGLLLLSPLLCWLIWRIRSDGGPALFGQIRIGRDGKPFDCLKFRTMVPDSDIALEELLQSDPAALEEWQSTHKLKDDPRITGIGESLRRSSLDELPQLWNVLRGDMSLVGPRPVVAEELQYYGDRSDLYRQVRPGMSGLWQVSGRNDTSYAERVALDAWYIKNWSLWYDIAIICKTVRVVMSRKGAY